MYICVPNNNLNYSVLCYSIIIFFYCFRDLIRITIGKHSGPQNYRILEEKSVKFYYIQFYIF